MIEKVKTVAGPYNGTEVLLDSTYFMSGRKNGYPMWECGSCIRGGSKAFLFSFFLVHFLKNKRVFFKQISFVFKTRVL